MLYYLINNSSIFEKYNVKAKEIAIILCGSIIYIVLHAILSFSKNENFSKLKVYYWFIFILDIIVSYLTLKNNNDDKNKNSLVKEMFDIKENLQNVFSLSSKNSIEEKKTDEQYKEEKTNEKETEQNITVTKEDETKIKNKEDEPKIQDIKDKKLSTPIDKIKKKQNNKELNQTTNEDTFNDTSSMSGSEMGFDISEFEQLL